MGRRLRFWILAGFGMGLLACSGDDGGISRTTMASMGEPVPVGGRSAAKPVAPVPDMFGAGATGVGPDGFSDEPPPAVAPGPAETEGCATGSLDTDGDGSLDCEDACPQDALKTEPGECGCGQPEPLAGSSVCEDSCDVGDGGCTVPDDPQPTSDAGVLDEPEDDLCAVEPISDELREAHDLNAVYTRVASARGVPILSSDSPQEEALRRACMLVRDLSLQPQVRETMLERKIGLVVMGVDETSADFPEFAAWGVPDSRARGLGGVPRGLCAEENVMCDRSMDRWRGESICVHEFAHTMHLGVYNRMDSTFDSRVRAAYRAAIGAGKFRNTYAGSSAVEYFGEAVQDWYNTNLESARANGVHNEINTREELLEYDPGIYEILSEVLPDEPSYQDCYYYE